jgi:hypothetical protein
LNCKNKGALKMAEVFSILKSVRLKLKDPAAVIDIAEASTIPTTVEYQKAYRVAGQYYVYNGTAWARVNLNISDDSLNTLIESKGENGAIVAAIPIIITGLLDEMRVVRMASGAESTEFLSLVDALNFYKSLRGIYQNEEAVEENTSTGRMFRSCKPTIGGVWE